MKRQIIFLAAVFISFFSTAQKNEYAYIKNSWWYTDMSYYSQKERDKIADAKISEYKMTRKTKKTEYVLSKMDYDKKGNCTSLIYYKKNGKPINQYLYEYSSDNKIINEKVLKMQKKEIKKSTFTYDVIGNCLEKTFSKKGKIKGKTVSKFDSTRVLESYYYKNGSNDYKRKWLYSYYPDKSKKSSVIYNAKGKVLYTWNYECKPEGELKSKHKDTTEVCKLEETDVNGNKTITVRKFNEKGKAYKEVRTFNKEDKLILYCRYADTGLPTNKCTYNAVTGNMEELIYYHKGKETFKSVNTYDGKNNITNTKYFHKGKQNTNVDYQYNPQSFVTITTYYNKKNELTETFKYEYTNL